MKSLEPYAFDWSLCRGELAEFKAMLDANPELTERQHVLPFFASHRNAAALIGGLNPGVHVYDRFAIEYDLFGDFACDVVIGDSLARGYTLVEFEDAARYSIFQRSVAYTPPWSRRFEHGYSQLIDWLWKLDDEHKTDEFRHRFGDGIVRFFGVLVIGRSAYLDPRGRSRLDWRFDRVIVNSKPILCLTYDDLYRVLKRKLDSMHQVVSTLPRSVAPNGGTENG